MQVGISEWSLHQNFARMVANPRPMTQMEFLDLAAERGAGLEEILAHERDFNFQSIRYARELVE